MREAAIGISRDSRWVERSLSDVTELLRRGTAPSYVSSSTVRVIGQRCVQISGFQAEAARSHDPGKMSRSLIAEHGDVLLNSTGTGTIGRSCLFDDKGIFVVDSHVTVLRARRDLVEPRWIDLILRSPWGQSRLESHCFVGSTNQVELSRVELAGTVIPVPPLDEQRRIVEVIDAVSAQERAIEASVAKLRETRRAALDAMLGALSWDHTLADVADGAIRNGFSPVETEEWTGVQMLGLGCLSASGFAPLQLKNAPSTVTADHKAVLQDGDLLMSRANTRELVGMVGVFRDVGTPCIYPDLMMRIRPMKGCSTRFLAASLMSTRGRRYIQSMAQGTSGSMVKISARTVREIPVPLPSLEEQRRVLSALASFDTSVETETAELAKLRTLRRGIVDDLLAGSV
ncbi:restriction endonuclease subunit S [Streptomyces daliensis]|uniref:Restriction endonuclease subunit S n=1 Tax=Streptomyces daliensis TaxID=299421 RepID=A0A8T4IVH6_9ACTN|nr:restriction endonuclease subunit S [Streptomyces daliensis]